MKILLVRTPFINIKSGPPIGLAYLSDVLKKADHDVNVIDLNVDINRKFPNIGKYTRDFTLLESHPAINGAYGLLDDYCREILTLSPDIVGFSLSYPTVEYGVAMARELSKHVRCIAGGPQATYNEKKLLDLGCFDTVVSGYGEEAILEALYKKGIISKPLERSKAYTPDYSDIPIENYNGRLPVLTTRGCPHRCTFCSQNLPLFLHPVESAVDQIKNTPGVREVMYNDSNININTDRAEKLFTGIAKLKNPPRGHVFGLEIKKGFQRYISKMAEAGVKVARVGIESGSIRERNSMNKHPFDNDLVVEFVKELTSHKITTWGQFIFCYPDQTEDDRQETLRLMNRINDSCGTDHVKHYWYRFIVHHGTEAFFKERYGVISSSPLNWENSMYTPEKIEKIYETYAGIVPVNAKILL